MSRLAPLMQLREAEVSAVDHLSETASVLAYVADSDTGDRLIQKGFVRLPTSVECLVSAPLDVASYGRNIRRSLLRARTHWDERRFNLDLQPLQATSPGWFFDKVYYPIFASAFYRQAISPHGLQKRSSAEALFERDVSLAVVRDAGGGVVGAALLERTEVQRAIPGVTAPTGRILEGLAHAFVETHQDLRRALYVELAASVARDGDRYLSLGRDMPWFEAPYVGVVEQKLRLANLVAFEQAPTRLYARWGSEATPAFVELTPSGPRWRAGSTDLQERLSGLAARAAGGCM